MGLRRRRGARRASRGGGLCWRGRGSGGGIDLELEACRSVGLKPWVSCSPTLFSPLLTSSTERTLDSQETTPQLTTLLLVPPGLGALCPSDRRRILDRVVPPPDALSDLLHWRPMRGRSLRDRAFRSRALRVLLLERLLGKRRQRALLKQDEGRKCRLTSCAMSLSCSFLSFSSPDLRISPSSTFSGFPSICEIGRAHV